MPTFELPAPFRLHTRRPRVRIAGATVREALDALVMQFPALEPLFFTAARELKRTVSLFVTDEDVRALEGLDTQLEDDEVIVVITAISGG